jgi:hypothetical protein
MLPLLLSGALLVGCDDKTTSKSPNPTTDAQAADAKSSADKAAANAKADANKDAADAKAKADKAAANAKADTDKAAANAKADVDKAAADAKTDEVKAAAEAVRVQASKLLADLKTAVTGQKWADADALVKQLNGINDKLAADQKASFESLKKQYDDNKR